MTDTAQAPPEERIALVTGATGAIGAAVSRALVGQGIRTAMLARNLRRLERLAEQLDAPDLTLPVRADVTQPFDLVEARDAIRDRFGADPDPATALRRALGELAATTEMVVAGVRVPDDPDIRRWLTEVDTDREPWLRPGRSAVRARDDLPGPGVGALVERLVARGLEPLVLDQTRPDVGLPVVRTVVPTLRPMWARFAPGRLFDVPVALGRLDAPTPYEGLNPRPVFL